MTDREQTIVRLWGDGVPAEEIAAVFGCSSQEIRREVATMRRAGVEIPLRRKPDRRRANDAPRLGTPYEQMLAGTWSGKRAAEQEAMRS